ncbi:MAG: phosphonoacetaldehyde reductase [Lachnospiraceae bacterium]|nr:phosphonoacetaldehyde reductase [Lachnospiraceae bacterium]
MGRQKLIWEDAACGLRREMPERGMSRVLLVCGKNTGGTDIGQHLLKQPQVCAVYSDFGPNPAYGDVLQALQVFEENRCNAILALGGGSAIDIAKCVKAFYGMDPSVNYLRQRVVPNKIPLAAVPTTAGTGSEATSFAVVYYKDTKYSVEDPSLVPELVLMDASLLKTLPQYQKKVTMLDAFCHCVESYWSKNATAKSREYASGGLSLILENYRRYLDGMESAAPDMLLAANLAGRAINIAKTTAAHAMCYQMTKLYGLPHGHAASLCLAAVWKYTWQLAKSQGNRDVLGNLERVAECLGCATVEESIRLYLGLLQELGISFDGICSGEDFSALAGSVNAERLKNHPVLFRQDEIKEMYIEIMGGSI